MKYTKPLTYLVSLLAAGNVLAAEPAPPETILRISAIDGVQNPDHKKEIKREYEKRVRLSADLFMKENGKLVSQHANAEEFVWTIKIGKTSLTCDPARAKTCSRNLITVTKEGISFIVFGGYQGLGDLSDAKFDVTVASAKDAAKSDKLVILNKSDLDRIQNNKEFKAEMAKIEEEQSGIGGFFNILGRMVTPSASSSSSREDAEQSRRDEREASRARWEQLKQLEKSSPSVARDLMKIERDKFEATHPQRDEDYGPSPGYGQGGHFQRPDWRNRGQDGNRFNRDNRNFPALPVSPPPAHNGGNFGGRPASQPAAPQMNAEQSKMIEELKAKAAAEGVNIKIIQTR